MNRSLTYNFYYCEVVELRAQTNERIQGKGKVAAWNAEGKAQGV